MTGTEKLSEVCFLGFFVVFFRDKGIIERQDFMEEIKHKLC